ncbi:ABC transporter ATP-binding protein [Gallaecimonas kandeliae]|uniref:ABC transporter ATP-binding protein n=1 Tax=Gallaecimonas kandeliae TaxID=3029055 RepID=UPI00264729BB|nr:ABC transporter ATP-binding protein [Gallaecimonas kandeliae]WKE65898.1 ABC transporter ATP-binding protein [Gallaecimonas kandeliae]
MITLTDIHKSYHTDTLETLALRGVSLTIAQGDYVSINGPSGCGKSTLLSVLGLMDDPSEGSYRLGEVEISALSRADKTRVRRDRIGFVFQSFNLIDELSVFDNVALPLRYQGLAMDKIQARVQECLEAVQLGHRAGHKPAQLSGGQQQRVAIARAIVTQPDLLLVDEPTGNLDSQNGEAIMALLDQLNAQGCTIVMVTHDNSFARRARRQLHLLDGKLIASEALRQAV